MSTKCQYVASNSIPTLLLSFDLKDANLAGLPNDHNERTNATNMGNIPPKTCATCC